ncbi:MAG TPA: winged helix-turn-helix domain-containing protein [Candidatus Tumulicola sp.]|jgi:DNA-binding winged helix-turn-helix (wHTH) protein/tetratricopeptide (TPR) repeat protein
MMPAMADHQRYYFGPFAVDCDQRRLVRGGVGVPLTPKAFDTLVILLGAAGKTVTADALMSELWPDDEEVNDATLRQHVLMVRRALGDRIPDLRYVVTDYGKGYRFVGPVSSGPSFLTQTLVEELCAAAAELSKTHSGAVLRSALDLYHRALTIDAESAEALAGAALCRCLIAENLRDPPRPLLEFARGQSESALRRDPDCVDALVARAKVALDGDCDVPAALALVQRAVSLAPKNPTVLGLNVWTLALATRFQEAHAFLDAHAEAISEHAPVRSYRGIVHLFERDYDGAIAELTSACDGWPHAGFARTCLGQARFFAGDPARALFEFDAVRLSAYDPLADIDLDSRFVAEAYALYTRFQFGDGIGAEASLQRLRRFSERQFVPAICSVLAEAGRRQYSQAMRHLQRCGANGEWWYVQSAIDPFLDDLRAYSRQEMQSPRQIDGGFAT